MRANKLGQFFKLDESRARFEGFLDIVVARHGSAGESLRAVFAYIDVLDEIINRRGFVTDPEHRFFMALLLNVDDRGRIFDLIKHRFPDADPIEKILDWVFDLAEIRLIGVDTSNAIGIENFGDAEMFALEHLLRGRLDDEIRQTFAAENPGADIGEAIAKIRNAVIFRPLVS